MSGKLDKSLDEILSSQRQSRRNVRRGSKPRANGTASTAPVGGVRKSTRQAKSAAKPTSAGPAPTSGESKIIVSGLPSDVTEQNIKEYFALSAGPVKRVMLTYNQNGTSRGVAAITFVRPETAAKAAKELNGLLIDKRPIKIEVVLDASRAPPAPTVKPLSERVAHPKSKPKPVSAAKTDRKRDSRGRGARRGRAGGRPKPKTAEQLDAEMADYFTETTTTAPAQSNGGAVPAPANEDMGMDEI